MKKAGMFCTTRAGCGTIMQEVNQKRRMVKTSIGLQILVVFFALLLMAAIDVAFDFQLMLHLIILFDLREAGGFLAFTGIYGLVYPLTVRTYSRIVQ